MQASDEDNEQELNMTRFNVTACFVHACLVKVKVKVKGPMWSGRHEDEGINTKNIVNRDRLSSKNTEPVRTASAIYCY